MHKTTTFLKRLLRDFFDEQIEFNLQIAYPDSINGITDFSPISLGDVWGKNYDTAFFKLTGSIPESWKDKEIYAVINSGGETLVLDKNQNPSDALTDASVFDNDYKKELTPLYKKCKGGEDVEIYLECTANGLFGMSSSNDPDVKNDPPEGSFVSSFKKGFFGIFNRDVFNLYHDVSTLHSYMEALPPLDYRMKKLKALVCNCICTYQGKSSNAIAARKAVKEALSWPATGSALEVTAIGHAHIDTAWLWPLEQTVKKCVRTFAAQLSLMDEYKEYTFGASAAYHYEIVKSEYPELYNRVKESVKSGRWEIQGGMFVEADCNVTSGESLVRQFLYGKNFFMDEFGIDVKNLWLPDVFGYPASLPQIIKKSGCDYFLTQKISWNDTNSFPNHTFYWKGIDGTKILTHFPPEDTYNAYMNSNRLLKAQDKYGQSNINNEFMSLYGIGDGGAGPSQHFVERGLRLANFEGSPKVKFGKAADFFEKINCKNNYPEWIGELYLELHRGTFTTQAFNKKSNRSAEQQLVELEMLFSMIPLEKYPEELIDTLWKTILVNQFHDIIPGSSINRVYKESREDYEAVFEMISRLRERFCIETTDRSADCLTLINTLSTSVCELVSIPWDGAETEDKEVLKIQNGKVKITIPPLSHVVLYESSCLEASKIEGKENIIENELIKYEFNDKGELVSIFDKELKREFLQGKGNIFSLYHDYPVNYEAWDIDKEYLNCKIENGCCVEMKKIEDGELYSCMKFRYTIGESLIEQTVTLCDGSKMLTFETDVEWKECRKMMRVGFESSLEVSEASYDIQYGYITRKNNNNTSWEQAKFEVSCHRYFDLSSRNYGIAMINDSKYGCRVDDGFFDLALLRSPKYPDFYADLGHHSFAYAIFPHCGDLIDSNVSKQAAAFNRRALTFRGKMGDFVFPINIKSGSIEICALKKAQKSNELVVRLLESNGVECEAEIELKGFSALKETNLIEWENGKDYKIENGRVKLLFKPFEIRTFFLK